MRQVILKHGIRIRRYDWYDRVALWRGRTVWGERQALGQTDTRYYFTLRRFVHRVEARTLSQMVVETDQVYGYSAT